MQQWIIDNIATIIAGLAMVVSYLSYRLSYKLRKEQGQAFLFLDIMQINSSLYVSVHNVGNTFAYDVKITISDPFVNRFSNLKLIQPGAVYRYTLLDSRDTGDYPSEVTFFVSYLDRYTKDKPTQKKYTFKLLDYLKYDITLNHELGGYDINKTY